MDRRGGHEIGSKEFVDIGDALHPSGHMRERDQGVRLTTTIVGIQTEDRGHLGALSPKTQAYVRQQVAQAPRGMGRGKKDSRVLVFPGGGPFQYLRQVRGIISLCQRTLEDIFSRRAYIEQSREQRHGMILLDRGDVRSLQHAWACRSAACR